MKYCFAIDEFEAYMAACDKAGAYLYYDQGYSEAAAAGATIDTSKVGSITLYKYDLTSATGDGVPVSSFVATGEKDAAAEAALADYAIQGVKFTYLKVADLGNRTTEPEDGKAIKPKRGCSLTRHPRFGSFYTL